MVINLIVNNVNLKYTVVMGNQLIFWYILIGYINEIINKDVYI